MNTAFVPIAPGSVDRLRRQVAVECFRSGKSTLRQTFLYLRVSLLAACPSGKTRLKLASKYRRQKQAAGSQIFRFAYQHGWFVEHFLCHECNLYRNDIGDAIV